MMYHLNIFKFLLLNEDHFYRVKQAENITGLRKACSILILLSMFLYGWMAYLGIGSNLILNSDLLYSQTEYEASKFWFIIGRAIYGVIYAAIIIFIPALIFKLLAGISFEKLVAMQLVVFSVVLIERLLWIPIIIFTGLDWYVSPLSLGIVASYITSKTWVIYFFGAITIFQVWIMFFQVKFISNILDIRKRIVWISVFFLHFVEWWLVTLVVFVAPYVIGRWF